MIFPGQFNIGLKEGGKVNLPLMEEGMVDAAIMVAYIPQGKRDDESLQQATDFAMNRLNEIHRQMEINRDRMNIARTDVYKRQMFRKHLFYPLNYRGNFI